MPIALNQIQFGEIDAKHEVFTQEREGSYVLLNAFQMPPSVNFERLMTGARFFISGMKGCGKTSLLLYLKDQITKKGGDSQIVLFKTRLTEPERQRITQIPDLTAFTDQDQIRFEQDYKVNWIWFIVSELARMIRPADVLSGHDSYNDLCKLTGANTGPRSSILSGLQLTKIRATIEAALKSGPFSSSVKTEIEAVSKDRTQAFMEIVSICERLLYDIQLLPGCRKALFFDELELFVGKLDQKDRDIYLIRDLLYAVSRINQGLGAHGGQICIYASVRSEVMYEVNRVSPEIERDVRDFGVQVDWHGSARAASSKILDIVDAKIHYSELLVGEDETSDVWNVYFDHRIEGKTARQYFMDISMFKPRTIVMLLSSVAARFPETSMITAKNVKDIETEFSHQMWREVEEEMRTSYDPETVAAMKRTLKGLPQSLSLRDITDHIFNFSKGDDLVRKVLGTSAQINRFLEDLYRVGAIGTHFVGTVDGKRYERDGWAFRHVYEPNFRGNIVFHGSLRKELQLTGYSRVAQQMPATGPSPQERPRRPKRRKPRLEN